MSELLWGKERQPINIEESCRICDECSDGYISKKGERAEFFFVKGEGGKEESIEKLQERIQECVKECETCALDRDREMESRAKIGEMGEMYNQFEKEKLEVDDRVLEHDGSTYFVE